MSHIIGWWRIVFIIISTPLPFSYFLPFFLCAGINTCYNWTLLTFLPLKRQGTPPPLNSKSRKISPLSTYPEKSWLFLKWFKKAFLKGVGTKKLISDCLGASWNQSWTKINILSNFMTFRTDKDLKWKKFWEFFFIF